MFSLAPGVFNAAEAQIKGIDPGRKQIRVFRIHE